MRCRRLLAVFPAALIRVPVLLACALLASPACDSFAAARASAPTPAPFTPVPGPDARDDPCVVARPSASATVETIIADDGACVTPSTLVLYRCDPSQEVVAVADIGGVARRFLGGAYAVHVDALPADAHTVGVTGAGRISTTPGDRALYVESGGRIERWLALPNPGTVSSPTAFMVGDSILDGGRDDVVAGLPEWDVTIDALIGRSSSGGITPAESLLQLPNVVVVELGVNDVSVTSFAANAQRILAAVQGADLVVWVTARRSPTRSIARSSPTWEPSGTARSWTGIAWSRPIFSGATVCTPRRGRRDCSPASSTRSCRAGARRPPDAARADAKATWRTRSQGRARREAKRMGPAIAPTSPPSRRLQAPGPIYVSREGHASSVHAAIDI